MKRIIPNMLTLLRLVLIPIVLYMSEANKVVLAVSLFAIAAATDFFDGALSRLWGVESDFGALWDPVVDKVLVMVFFLYLKSTIWSSLVWLVCLRDMLLLLCIPLLRQLLGFRFTTKPTFITKLSSTLNMTVIFLIFLNKIELIPELFLKLVMVVALGFCLLTYIRFISYLPTVVRTRQTAR